MAMLHSIGNGGHSIIVQMFESATQEGREITQESEHGVWARWLSRPVLEWLLESSKKQLHREITT